MVKCKQTCFGGNGGCRSLRQATAPVKLTSCRVINASWRPKSTSTVVYSYVGFVIITLLSQKLSEGMIMALELFSIIVFSRLSMHTVLNETRLHVSQAPLYI